MTGQNRLVGFLRMTLTSIQSRLKVRPQQLLANQITNRTFLEIGISRPPVLTSFTVSHAMPRRHFRKVKDRKRGSRNCPPLIRIRNHAATNLQRRAPMKIYGMHCCGGWGSTRRRCQRMIR